MTVYACGLCGGVHDSATDAPCSMTGVTTGFDTSRVLVATSAEVEAFRSRIATLEAACEEALAYVEAALAKWDTSESGSPDVGEDFYRRLRALVRPVGGKT